MFLFCSTACVRIVPWLARTQPSNARRRPRPPGPSPLPRRAGVARAPPPQGPEKAGPPPPADLTAPPAAGVAAEDARRRGRGAQSNATGRYEPLARIAFDDGWQSFEELPPFKTTV